MNEINSNLTLRDSLRTPTESSNSNIDDSASDHNFASGENSREPH